MSLFLNMTWLDAFWTDLIHTSHFYSHPGNMTLPLDEEVIDKNVLFLNMVYGKSYYTFFAHSNCFENFNIDPNKLRFSMDFQS